MLFTAFGGGAFAQPYLGIHFVGSKAQNTFCDSAYRNGYGFSMEFFSNNLLRNTPQRAVGLRFGLGWDIQWAGHHSESVILNTPNSDPGKEKFSNTHLGLTASARLTFMPYSRLTPYIDGHVGLRGFYTNQILTMDDPSPEYESSTSNSILSTGTQRYGGSVGLMYRLTNNIYLDTRVTYSKGTAGNWINLNNINYENGVANYDRTRTTTDLLIYHVGFNFRFNCSKKTSNTSPSNNTTPKNTTPKKEIKKRKTVTETPSPSPTPKKPLEVKPTPPPAPKPKPQN